MTLDQVDGPTGPELEDFEHLKYCSNVPLKQQVSIDLPRLSKILKLTPIEIDIWSCGVILLTFLSRRFPFFNSSDDSEALIEIASIFGLISLQECALLHGQMFETNIPTIIDHGYSLEYLVEWCNNKLPRERARREVYKAAAAEGVEAKKNISILSPDEMEAIDFMKHCLDVDFRTRISASDALLSPFINGTPETSDDASQSTDES